MFYPFRKYLRNCFFTMEWESWLPRGSPRLLTLQSIFNTVVSVGTPLYETNRVLLFSLKVRGQEMVFVFTSQRHCFPEKKLGVVSFFVFRFIFSKINTSKTRSTDVSMGLTPFYVPSP